jgi:Ca-activated chloride channel family protein
MSFASPWLLLFLLLVPLAIGGYFLLERRRSHRAASWSTASLMPNMVPRRPGFRRYIPLALFLLALILLLAGFARPQAKINVPREGATVVLAMDVSGSMASKDVAPSRIIAARTAAAQFLNQLPDKYRASLVTFSNHTAVRVAPTYNHAQVIRALPTTVEEEGTALASGIETATLVAARAVGQTKPGQAHPPAAILLLSDGAQSVGQVEPADAAAKARKLDIPIYTVSLGTPAGVVVQKIPHSPGNTEVIQVPPSPQTLQDVARITGGTAFQAHSPAELAQVYKDIGHRLVKDKKNREITVAVAGAAVLCLIAGALLSGLWFRRIV